MCEDAKCASIRKYNTTYKVRVRCGFENPREIRHFEGAKSDNTPTTTNTTLLIAQQAPSRCTGSNPSRHLHGSFAFACRVSAVHCFRPSSQNHPVLPTDSQLRTRSTSPPDFPHNSSIHCVLASAAHQCSVRCRSDSNIWREVGTTTCCTVTDVCSRHQDVGGFRRAQCD